MLSRWIFATSYLKEHMCAMMSNVPLGCQHLPVFFQPIMDVELVDVCVVVIGCAGLSALVFASSPVHDIASSMPLRSYLGPMSALPVPGLVVFGSFAFIASPLRPDVGAVALDDSCWLASGCDRADCRAASCKPMHCHHDMHKTAPAPSRAMCTCPPSSSTRSGCHQRFWASTR